MWFQDIDGHATTHDSEEEDDGWGGLSGVGGEVPEEESEDWQLLQGKQEEFISNEKLPFTRLKLTPDDEEEDQADTIRTGGISASCYDLSLI